MMVLLFSCAEEDEDDSVTQKTDKELTVFSFEADSNDSLETTVTATITDSLITASVPYGVSLTNLVASFTTTGNSVVVGETDQESGVTVNDFSNDVTYTVTAEDGTTQNYVASVSNSTFMPTQSAIMRTSNVDAGYHFGGAVAIDGDMATVLAQSATIPSSSNKGAVYILEKANGTWEQSQILYPSNPDDLNASLGTCDIMKVCLDISGNIVITADYKQDTGSGDGSGAVYIFEKQENGNWSETLLKYTLAQWGAFGSGVAVSGDYAFVGAPYDSSVEATYHGAVYVYKRAGIDNWSLHQTIVPTDTGSMNYFGFSVDIDGDYLIVGEYKREVTVGGSSVSGAGSAYIYKKNATSDQWEQVATLSASDAQTDDFFGYWVNISGDYAAVSAKDEDGGDGDPLSNTGAVYIFKRESDAVWTQTQILHLPETDANSYMGRNVSIDGNGMVIGISGRDIEVDGSGLTDAGTAWVLELDSNGTWQLNTTLTASNAQATDLFGASAAIDGGTVLIGAISEDGGDGDPSSETGAVYLFE